MRLDSLFGDDIPLPPAAAASRVADEDTADISHPLPPAVTAVATVLAPVWEREPAPGPSHLTAKEAFDRQQR